MTEPDTMEAMVTRLRETRRASRAQRIARGDRLAALLDKADREGERRDREEKARERARLLDLLGKDVPQRQRQRKPSIAALIRQARKAGERGPVRVTLPDGNSITSEREAALEQISEADAERLWLERAAKHAH
jgi:hypothetical protein